MSQSRRHANRYVPFDELACGGMATVHLGVDVGASPRVLADGRSLARAVALKRLHPHYARDPDFVRMLQDEARLVSRIDHPNVVKLIEVVAEPDELLLVLEYVAGESLLELLRASRAQLTRIPAPVVVAIAIGLLRGLDAAHGARDEQGHALSIVHRDVSPHNVMISSDGRVRLIDFGVAKAAGRLHTTRERSLKGKLPYMAPEQVRGTGVSAATDIYAASVVLWELLTARRLFKGDNEAMILEQVMLGYVSPPSRFAPETPEAVDRIVLRGLQSSASARFTTAGEMADALEGAVPPATPSELAAWVRSLSGEALDRRAAKVNAAMKQVASKARASWEQKRRRVIAAASGAAMVCAVALIVVASTGSTTAAPPPHAATAALARIQPVEAPTASIDEPASSDVLMELPALENDVVAVTAARVPAPPRARAPSHAAIDCATPYTRDSVGRKVYKLDCLRR